MAKNVVLLLLLETKTFHGKYGFDSPTPQMA
jgi:hypothetical protein